MILSIKNILLEWCKYNDNNKTKNKILVIYLLKNVIVVTSPSLLY
jgi:hypothetical protein